MATGTTGLGELRAPLGERLLPYGLNIPAILLLLGLVAYPMGLSFWLSLHKVSFRRLDAGEFVGLGNYFQALTSAEFANAVSVTFRFAALSVPLIVITGLGLALLLNAPLRGRAILRALVLVPWAIPPIANATLWQLLFDSHVGAVNGALLQAGLIASYQAFMVQPDFALIVVVLAHTWNHVPLAAIIFLAALQAIPRDLYEAARIDRASALRSFWSITVPWLLRPALVILILQTMGALRAFDLLYVLTGGGPGNATTTVAWLTYQKTFVFLDVGMGSAYAYILMLITFVMAIIYIRSIYTRGDIE